MIAAPSAPTMYIYIAFLLLMKHAAVGLRGINVGPSLHLPPPPREWNQSAGPSLEEGQCLLSILRFPVLTLVLPLLL